MRISGLAVFTVLTALAALTILPVHAQAPAKDHLQFTVILNRHGIRTPLNNPEQLAEYSPEPWPIFHAPTFHLTPRGGKLMQIMGAYDREYLIEAGLLQPKGCGDADKFYFRSDDTSRDVDSAWDLGRALMPECDPTIHGMTEGHIDPVFKPTEAHIGPYDLKLAREAFLKAAAASPKAIPNGWRTELEAVNHVLFGCQAGAKCPPGGITAKKLIMQQPVEPTADTPEGIFSPLLASAFSVADALIAEYLDGITGKNLGWGRLDDATLHQLRVLQDRYLMTTANPYNAKAVSSNLLNNILLALEQADRGMPVPGALGKAGDKALILFGHDSDIVRVSNLLGVSWEVEKGLPKDVPPDCALIFELWRNAAGQSTIRVYFQTQTFAQLMSEQALTLKAPPARVALRVPKCDPCSAKNFATVVSAAIDRAFLAAAPNR